MSKEDILSIFYTNSQQLTPMRILLILTICLCGAAVICLTYRYTYDRTNYNASFNVGNLMASLITCVIMMMISSNIVISLGMVGALSIVRFRTAVKEARDTLFLFWVIMLGLCVGSQNFLLSGISTLFIGAVCFAMHLMPASRRRYSLILRFQSDPALDQVEEILLAATTAHQLEALNRSSGGAEAVYSLRCAPAGCAALVNRLSALDSVARADLVSGT